MSTSQAITYVDDQRLVDFISAALRRVVYMAPGVTESVAEALAEARSRLGVQAVTVIVDLDPEVCRLGFGTLDGVKRVFVAASKVGTSVCQQPGVRIGLIISDDRMIVYSPTPLLIEEAGQPQRLNAIALHAPPPEMLREIGLGEDPASERIVGDEPVKKADIEIAQVDLDSAPPMKFDLARRLRVFTTRFQFVEFKLTGCYMSRKKAPIPSSLVGLARNREVQSQFHAHFDLVAKGALGVKVSSDRAITEASLQARRLEIERQFLVPLKGYGSVVLRANKAELENAVASLRTDVEAFQNGIVEALQSAMDDSATALVDALLPAVKSNPPKTYTKLHGQSIAEAQVRQLLERDIARAFGPAEALVKQMEVSLVFKDVAIESLQDEEFLRIAREAMPSVESLHEVFDAAPTAEGELRS